MKNRQGGTTMLNKVSDWYWQGALFSRPKRAPNFVGREVFKDKALSFLCSERSVLHIVGFGGIGKTFLCAWLAWEIKSKRKVAWIDCRQQSISVDALIASIGYATKDNFISQKLNISKVEETSLGASDPLQECIDRCVDLMEHHKTVLFFEDFHELDMDSSTHLENQFLRGLINGLRNAKIIIASRRYPSIWADPELRPYQKNIQLTGFSVNELDKYLIKLNIKLKEDELDLLWRKTGKGVPKAVELLANKMGAGGNIIEIIKNAPLYEQGSDSEWLKEQIQDISYDTKQFLNQLSILRRSENIAFLKKIWGMRNFDNCLNALKSRCLLDETVSYPEHIQLFNLIREYVLHNEIAKEDKRNLHLKVAHNYFLEAKIDEKKRNALLIEAVWHAEKGKDHEMVLLIAKYLNNTYLDVSITLISQIDKIIINSARVLSNYEILCEWLVHFGSRAFLSGSSLDSLTALQEARAIAKKQDNILLWIDITRKLARAHNARGEYSQSLILIKECLEKETDLKDEMLALELIMEHGNYLLRNDFVSEAEAILCEALDLARDYSRQDIEAETMVKLARLFLKSKKELTRLSKAKELLMSAEKISLDLNLSSLLGEIYGLLGDYHRYLNEASQALSYYNESRRLVKALGSKSKEAITIGQMAFLERDRGNIEKAIEYSKRSYDLDKQFGNIVGTQIQVVLLGELYIIQDKYVEAYQCLREGLRIAKDENNPQPIGEASAYRGFAKYYLKMDKLEEAKFYINQAIEGYVNQSKYQYAKESLDVLRKIYKRENDTLIDKMADDLTLMVFDDELVYKTNRIEILVTALLEKLKNSSFDKRKINTVFSGIIDAFTNSEISKDNFSNEIFSVLDEIWPELKPELLESFIIEFEPFSENLEDVIKLYGYLTELVVLHESHSQMERLVEKIILHDMFSNVEKFDLLESLEEVFVKRENVAADVSDFYVNIITEEIELAIRQNRVFAPYVNQMRCGLYFIDMEKFDFINSYIKDKEKEAKENLIVPDDYSSIPNKINIKLEGKTIAIIGGSSKLHRLVEVNLTERYDLSKKIMGISSWEDHYNKKKVENTIQSADLIIKVPRDMSHGLTYALNAAITNDQESLLRDAPGKGKSSVIRTIEEFFIAC